MLTSGVYPNGVTDTSTMSATPKSEDGKSAMCLVTAIVSGLARVGKHSATVPCSGKDSVRFATPAEDCANQERTAQSKKHVWLALARSHETALGPHYILPRRAKTRDGIPRPRLRDRRPFRG